MKVLPQNLLHVSLLGAPLLHFHNRPYDIPRRQTHALLYYLAVSEQPVPRDRLAFLLWPDEDNASARRKLSRLLTHLRSALPESEYIQTPNDQVSLDGSLIWCDAREVRQCHRQFTRRTHPPPAKAGAVSRSGAAAAAEHPAVDSLCRAANLYRGEFLAGFALPHHHEYAAWLTEERATWLRTHLDVLTALVEHFAPLNTATAIDYAQEYLQVDALAEHMHRRLMQLYLREGQREAAQRQYEQCRALLHEELGVEPLAETRAVHREIQRTTSVAAAATQIAAPPATQRASPALDSAATAAIRLPAAFRLPETLLRDFIEHVPAAVAILDRNMRYLLASQRWYEDYRIEETDIIGRSHYDVFPEIPQRWRAKHQRILAGAVERCPADPFPRADGTLDWVRWEVRPWYIDGSKDSGSKIGGIVMFTQVITKQKEMETSLRRHRDHLEQLVSQRLASFSAGQAVPAAPSNLLQKLEGAQSTNDELAHFVSMLADDLQATLQTLHRVTASGSGSTEGAKVDALLTQAETLVQGLRRATVDAPSPRQMTHSPFNPTPTLAHSSYL